MNKEPIKILAVDDEADLELLLRQKMRHRIRSNELIFTFRTNGQEALDTLETDVYHIVILDINMPVMDGLTALSSINSFPEAPATIVVSAYGDSDNIRTAMNRGAFDFITKPIDFNDLEITINRAIRSREYKLGGINAMGYIPIEMPEGLKSFFNDILKSFEDYALFNGYKLSVSIDNSLANKVAFKFSCEESSLNIHPSTVRNDIVTFIHKITCGEELDEIPTIFTSAEKSLVAATFRNRINYLRSQYELEKNARIIYEGLANKISKLPDSFFNQPLIYIQTGGINSSKQLKAQNSSNIIIGNENEVKDNVSDYSQINISDSFNERKPQVEKINEIISLLKKELKIDPEIRQSLITNFDKIKDELIEEKHPDKPKIFKWLNNTKKTIENLVLSREAYEAIKWIYEKFNFLLPS